MSEHLSSRHQRPPTLRSCNALFLDIDGTLLDFADSPAEVQVDAELRAMLPSLARMLGGAMALITGRRIADVDQLFPGLDIPVAGQHGCERRAADGTLHDHQAALSGFTRMRDALSGFAARHEGLRLEDKGQTLALHYRLVPDLAVQVRRTLRAQIEESTATGDWELQPGKNVLEVKPSGRDKGTSILEYMREQPFAGRLPVFVGDDATDEYGFRAVAQLGGIAVKVGNDPTGARFCLPDIKAVRNWLRGALES